MKEFGDNLYSRNATFRTRVFPHHIQTDDQHHLKLAGVSGTHPVWAQLLHKSPAPHYLSRYLSLDMWLILLTGTKRGHVSLLSTQPSAYFLPQDLENVLFTKAKVDFYFFNAVLNLQALEIQTFHVASLLSLLSGCTLYSKDATSLSPQALNLVFISQKSLRNANYSMSKSAGRPEHIFNAQGRVLGTASITRNCSAPSGNKSFIPN